MHKLTDLLRERNYRQTVEEMERTSKDRDTLLCEKIDAHAKICYRCEFFCEHRSGEPLKKYGEFSGFCYYDDKGQERREEFGVVPDHLIVNDEFTCSQFKDACAWERKADA